MEHKRDVIERGRRRANEVAKLSDAMAARCRELSDAIGTVLDEIDAQDKASQSQQAGMTPDDIAFLREQAASAEAVAKDRDAAAQRAQELSETIESMQRELDDAAERQRSADAQLDRMRGAAVRASEAVKDAHAQAAIVRAVLFVLYDAASLDSLMPLISHAVKTLGANDEVLREVIMENRSLLVASDFARRLSANPMVEGKVDRNE